MAASSRIPWGCILGRHGVGMAQLTPIPVRITVSVSVDGRDPVPAGYLDATILPTPAGYLDATILPTPAGDPDPVVDPVAIIRSYLELVDPNQLEAEALSRTDLTGSVTAAILATLHDHATDILETA